MGAVKPELPQTPPPFIGPPPAPLILVGLARCCWFDEGSLLAMIEMERARCGQTDDWHFQKTFERTVSVRWWRPPFDVDPDEKFQALMAGKP
jgi:hypothetical protein